jgi:hypothetical protein
MRYLNNIWLVGLRKFMKILDQVSKPRSLLHYQILVPKLLSEQMTHYFVTSYVVHSMEMLKLVLKKLVRPKLT